MSLTTPLINGAYPSWADVVFRTNGLQFVGITELNYSDDMKRSRVYGTQRVQLGLTAGKYESDGDVTFLLPAASLLLATLAISGALLGGFRFIPLACTVSYQPLGPVPLVTDAFVCFLGKQEAKGKVSDDALDRKFSLYLATAIVWNGAPGCFDLNSIGAVA